MRQSFPRFYALLQLHTVDTWPHLDKANPKPKAGSPYSLF